MKTLVLGGYGNFGASIVRALARRPGLELLVGGRDVSRVQALADNVGCHAKAVAIDWTAANFASQLKAWGVDLLIHTAGPFQQQGYDVALAAARAGAHYIDLADGRRFVCDFPSAVHPAFLSAGRCAITGASTVPALSSAVVAHLTEGWQRIDSIDLCIAPAQTAPRGVATLEAVLSYCGLPIDVWTEGRWQQRVGWAHPRRVHFARMRPRWSALCDIPDLELFPSYFRVTQQVMFRAALEVPVGQWAFAAMAALRRMGVVREPQRWARPLNAAARAFDFLGSALGGMVVRVQGVDERGASAQRAWHISADHDHGPEIPCMAAIVLAQQLARGECFPPGAQACMNLVPLAQFEPEFARWQMVTDVIDETPNPQ